MKQWYIWLCCISFFAAPIWGQQLQDNDSIEVVAIKKEAPMALRFGIDLYRPIRSQIKEDFEGFELVGDLKVYNDLYVALELGNENRTLQSEQLNFSTKGNYLKLGIDYNMYDNWKGMNNQVYIGLRFGNSLHQQTVNNYTLYSTTHFWPEALISNSNATKTSPNLSAQWIEVLAGIKVQIIHNFYLGLSLRLNRLLNQKQPDNFNNLYLPGFNKVTDENNFGVGFNYTLTYSIPFRFGKKTD
ncbi:MAG: DUF6048 family protein [Flavobacteriaceae bacterium]